MALQSKLFFLTFLFFVFLYVCPQAGAKPMQMPYDAVQLDLGYHTLAEVKKPLQAALNALLMPSEELESPLNNAASLLTKPKGKSKGSDKDQLRLAQELLSKHFNRDSTEMVLLDDRDRAEGEGETARGYAPERGEDPKKFWIFSLTMPSLSDHIYWIVVSRDGGHKAYVYGFN